MSERELKTVISGGFSKFKPEIDLAIQEFEDLGVTVLGLGKGWLYIPPSKQPDRNSSQRFRPLPSEIGRTIKQIEDGFLQAVEQSDFLYIVNPEGFIGESVALEIGFAIAKRIPIYSQKQIPLNLEPDPLWKELLSHVNPLPPEKAMVDVISKKAHI